MRRIVTYTFLVLTTILIGCSQVRPEERPEPVNHATDDPITAFQASPQSGVAPLLVTFEWAASGGEVCTIDFGDGASETVACTAGSLTHDYQDPGTFTAVFTAQANGRTYNRDRQIAATTAPPGSLQSTFRADPTVTPIGTAVAFTWTVSGPSETCVLDFNDGSAPLSFSPCENGSHSHTYSAVGNYAATFVVTATDGTTDSKVATVNIATTANEVSPIESFTANPTQGVAPLAVDIAWHAPDAVACVLHIGSDSYGVSCSDTRQETFSVVGTHTITFAATSATGTPFEQNATVRVGATPNSVPEVTHFSATPQKVSEGDPVTFSWTATDDDGDPLTCSIAFGDGSTWQGDCATGSTDHTYTSAGKYQSEITASDPTGASAGLRTSVEVTTPGGTTPTIVPPAIQKFTVTPITGEKPLAVSVSWEYSNQGGEPVTCTIHSGIAGASPDTFNPCPETGTHTLTYPDEGTYTLKFSARKDGANATERTQSITVTDTFVQPKPALSGVSVSPTSGRAPLPVTANFSVDPNGDPTTCTINWADGSPLTTINNCDGSISENHTFTGKGDYQITVTAENSGGRTTYTQQIRVDPQLPEITSLNASPATGTAPIDVEFSWTIDTFGETYQCTLDPGDGTGPVSVAHCASPVTHRYTEGTDPLNAYTATLAITALSVAETTDVEVRKPDPIAGVLAGTRAASLNTGQVAIVGKLLTNLLGANIEVSGVDYNGLASVNVTLFELFENLADVDTTLAVLTPRQILETPITLDTIIQALALIPNATNLLGNLPSAMNRSEVIELDKILSIPSTILDGIFSETGSSVSLPVLDILIASIQLFNHTHVASASVQTVELTGQILSGLGVTDLATIHARIGVIEPPVITIGGAGATFNSAGIRVLSNLTLVKTDVGQEATGLIGAITSVLTDIPLISALTDVTSQVTIADLQVGVTVAQTTGVIDSLARTADSVVLKATPGLASIFLGKIDETQFFSPTYNFDENDVSSGELLNISVSAKLPLVVEIQINLQAMAKGAAIGGVNQEEIVSSFATVPDTRTISANGASVSDLVTSLVDNLEIQIPISTDNITLDVLGLPVGTLLGDIASGLAGATQTLIIQIKSVLTNIGLADSLKSLLNRLLPIAGTSIGSSDLTLLFVQ